MEENGVIIAFMDKERFFYVFKKMENNLKLVYFFSTIATIK